MSLSDLPPGVVANAGNNKTLEYIIGKAFLEAERTCTSPWVLGFAAKLRSIPITFHTLMKILAATACIFNCVCSIYLITGHVLNWVRPHEQRQIIRIILWDVVFSTTAFFSIYFYASQGYIHPIAVYYEGFAMTGIFLLYVHLVCPNENDRAQYFTNLERKWYNGKSKKDSNGSLRWFRIIWILVFQVTFTRIATIIAQDVLYGLTCPLSTTRANGSIAIQVVQGVSTGIAVYAIITFERRMHSHLTNHGHRPLLKLVSFKFIVGIEAIQDILFSALADTGVYFPQPPYRVSWADFAIGVPQLILVFEMVGVSIAFLWSFTFEDYRSIAVAGEGNLTLTWRAFAEVMDVSDIWQAVKYMFTCFTASTYLEGPIDGRAVERLAETTTGKSDDYSMRSENDINPAKARPYAETKA